MFINTLVSNYIPCLLFCLQSFYFISTQHSLMSKCYQDSQTYPKRVDCEILICDVAMFFSEIRHKWLARIAGKLKFSVSLAFGYMYAGVGSRIYSFLTSILTMIFHINLDHPSVTYIFPCSILRVFIRLGSTPYRY